MHSTFTKFQAGYSYTYCFVAVIEAKKGVCYAFKKMTHPSGLHCGVSFIKIAKGVRMSLTLPFVGHADGMQIYSSCSCETV